MQTATGILRKEHDAILKMLDVADETAALLDRGASVSPAVLSNLLEFFRLFADKCHHGKEEDLLFPALERKGMPRHGGPIGVMLIEHDLGRGFVRQMVEAAEAFSKGDAAAGKRWADAARQYTSLLREHIMKENNILFVMAERLLTDAEQQALAIEFDRVETEKMGIGTHERLHAMMDKLVAEILSGKSGH